MDNPIKNPNQAQEILWQQLNDLCHPAYAVPLHYSGSITVDFQTPDPTKMFLCLWFTAVGNYLGHEVPSYIDFFDWYNNKDYGLGYDLPYFNGTNVVFCPAEVQRANFYCNSFSSPNARYLWFSFTGFRLTIS